MEQKEHIATLCALGTIGAAAAGLAFGTTHIDTLCLRPGKRKWPGSSTSTWTIHNRPPHVPRRSVSHPVTPTISYNSDTSTTSPDPSTQTTQRSQFLAPSKEDDSLNVVPSSRGSSASRQSAIRPRTAASRSNGEIGTPTLGTSWLKRLSSFSTHSASSTPSIKLSDKDTSNFSSSSNSRPATSDQSLPNKLVKRSISQRAVSHDEARGQVFRRPATSHQRSQTFRDVLVKPLTNTVTGDSLTDAAENHVLPQAGAEKIPQSLRPYFETAVPRKRRKSETAADPSQIRTVMPSSVQVPWLTHGHSLLIDDALDDTEQRQDPVQRQRIVSAPTKKTARSLSVLRKVTRRRNVTDPSLQVTSTAVNGTITTPVKQPSTSTVSKTSIFEITLPKGTPVFNSSPLSSQQNQHRTTFNPRLSIAPSDPTTANSDTDMLVFSDDESSELRSDTAYDSIATRTTHASNAAIRGSNLDTIFAERMSLENDAELGGWDHLADSADHDQLSSIIHSHSDAKMHGMGISILDAKAEPTPHIPNHTMISTPPRSASFDMEDLNDTPVPMRTSTNEITSSPPRHLESRYVKNYEEIGNMLRDMNIDEVESDEIDWSPKSGDSVFDHDTTTAMNQRSCITSTNSTEEWDMETIGTLSQKQSIFDYSEHHSISTMLRPKTAHGKQGDDIRSRSNGRRTNPQLHFRSQSVPVNRDGPLEDVPVPSKFATWKLGHTRVTEEWSDDFEFEDEPNDPMVHRPESDVEVDKRDSVKSVKIPQTIIDKQPSVHLQFGQVQEFMLLVEELKRLRLAGAKLQLLDGNARGLWEDAESIINLATINDDEENLEPFSASPTVPASQVDEFSDVSPLVVTSTAANMAATRGRRPTIARRSVSDVKSPLATGRTRGESIAQTQHFLHTMHKDRTGFEPSPRDIELHHEKKTPFDTQDLKDLVIRSGAITRQLKEEIRRADPVSVSPRKTPTKAQALEDMFRAPRQFNTAESPTRAKALPHSQNANSYLEQLASKNNLSPFSSPQTYATAEQW